MVIYVLGSELKLGFRGAWELCLGICVRFRKETVDLLGCKMNDRDP